MGVGRFFISGVPVLLACATLAVSAQAHGLPRPTVEARPDARPALLVAGRIAPEPYARAEWRRPVTRAEIEGLRRLERMW